MALTRTKRRRVKPMALCLAMNEEAKGQTGPPWYHQYGGVGADDPSSPTRHRARRRSADDHTSAAYGRGSTGMRPDKRAVEVTEQCCARAQLLAVLHCRPRATLPPVTHTSEFFIQQLLFHWEVQTEPTLPWRLRPMRCSLEEGPSNLYCHARNPSCVRGVWRKLADGTAARDGRYGHGTVSQW